MKSKYSELKEQLNKAYIRFEEAMQKPMDAFMRDSAIQRFEFTFELVWKTLKAHLEEKGAREIYLPRDVLKEAFRAGLIDDEKWLDMLDTRNATSHMYNEAMADNVYEKLPQYVDLIRELLKKLA